jgi:hypothetical protein
MSRRAFAAIFVGLVVGAAFVLTWAASGYSAAKPRLLSGAAWLTSSQVGQLTLLDGSSAEVAAQVQVAPRGNKLDVVQQLASAYAVDRTAGSIRRVDGATFELSAPMKPIPQAGDGLTVFAGENALYALDTRRGVLAEADPRTLGGRGGLTSLAAQVDPRAATLDSAGRLWLLDTTTGDLSWLDSGTRHLRRQAAKPGSGLLALADGAPVLVDIQQRTASTLDPETGQIRRTTALDLRAGEHVEISGAPHASRLYVVAARGVLSVCSLTQAACSSAVPLASESTDLGAAVESGGRVFVPDYTSGRVWIVDLRGSRVVAQPQVLPPRTQFQLLTRDGVVFFNDPNSEHAGVIRLDGGVKQVPKYDPNDPNKGLRHEQADNGVDDNAPVDEPPAADNPQTDNPNPKPTKPPARDTAIVQIVVSTRNPLLDADVVLQAVGPNGKAQPTGARWNFGDGQAADGTRVNHSWTAARTFQVSVRATFADGQTAVASLPIRVAGLPRLTVQQPTNGTVTGPGGIDCPTSCTATFGPGQNVTLTANPGGGFGFLGWGGACRGTNRTCTLAMAADRTVSALFGTPPRLTIQAPTSGSITGPNGINCPGTCVVTLAPGQVVTLTARPAGGFGLSGWGGACSGTQTTCRLTMNGDKNVSATFAVRPKLTVIEPGAGHITGTGGINCPGTCTATYNPGQKVTLRAVGSATEIFFNWEGDCAGTATTCTLTMNSDKEVDSVWAIADPCPPACMTSQLPPKQVYESMPVLTFPGRTAPDPVDAAGAEPAFRHRVRVNAAGWIF